MIEKNIKFIRLLSPSLIAPKSIIIELNQFMIFQNNWATTRCCVILKNWVTNLDLRIFNWNGRSFSHSTQILKFTIQYMNLWDLTLYSKSIKFPLIILLISITYYLKTDIIKITNWITYAYHILRWWTKFNSIPFNYYIFKW